MIGAGNLKCEWSRLIGLWKLTRAFADELWTRCPRKPTGELNLAALGEELEKRGYYD
jgi:hypothetical protein